jgi:CHAD domain-containing protein
MHVCGQVSRYNNEGTHLTLREHVRSHTATLLRRLAFQVRQTSLRADEEAVHDLRVAIRRLRECLRTFKPLYPGTGRKKVRKELRKLMKLAEVVRSADIALGLLKKAGTGETAPVLLEIHKERDRCRLSLHEELKALSGRRYTRNWREALGL